MAAWRSRNDSSPPHEGRPSERPFCSQKRHLPCCVCAGLVVGVFFGLALGLQLANVRTLNLTDATAKLFVDVKSNKTGKYFFLRGSSCDSEPRFEDPNISLTRSGVAVSTYTNPGVESMLKNYFANEAVEREVRKHDRWVIESLSFLNNFNGAASYAHFEASSPKTVTLVVLTVNRRVPYLAVLVSMLLRGNDPAVFVENMEVHIVNIERRAGRERYYLLDEIRDKVPFFQYHDWTATYPQHAGLKSPYLADQRLDYIRVLGLCEVSGSRWCVVMEDDACPVNNFVNKFKMYVDKDMFLNASENGMGDVSLDQIAMVKLFNPFNPQVREKWDEPKSKIEKRVARKRNATPEMLLYERNRAADWPQAHGAGVPVQKLAYQVKSVAEWWSVVANAYPFAGLNRTIAYLQRKDSRLGHATDISLNKGFVREEKLVLLGTSPSLVNHVGFYSENENKNWKETGISTDIRFQLDDGSI